FRRIRLLALIGLVLIGSHGQAAEPAQGITERGLNTVLVHNYDVDDGLPQNTVHAIAQTRDGYLWAATWEGLARFNGIAFKVFDPSNVPDLSSGGVRSLLATDDGSLWLGQSENGIARVRQGRWSRALGDTDIVDDQVLALIVDSAQRVYVGTADHGVKVIDQDSVRRLGDPGRRVLGMALDSDGDLLLATHLGLQRVDIDSGTTEDFGGGQTRSVLEAAGRIFVGGDEGLHELLDSGLRRIDLPASMKSASITTMLGDRQGRLWFGTQSEGLFRATFAVDGRIALIERLGIAEGLPNLRVISLAFDHEGSLWVGTNGGLSQVIETGIAQYGPIQGLDNAFARTLAEAPNGDIYIGTSGGLYQYRDGQLLAQWAARELGSSSVTALVFDSVGDLWIGTYDAGVSQMRDGRVIAHLDRRNGLHQLSVRTLLFDADGSLWLGTSEGLVHYTHGEGMVIDLFPKLAPDFILSLTLAPDRSLWIGTAIGLAHRDLDGNVRTFDKAGGYPALDTFDIQFEDADSAWLATDAGLLLMRDGHFRALGRAQGMPSDTLFRLLIDSSGAFWLTSNRGLARVDRKAIEAVLDGTKARLVPTLLTADNGMTATQCNGGTAAAGMLASDGSLWIPTSNGVSHLQPAKYPLPPRPAVPLSVESVSVDGIETSLPLEVPAAARRIEFDLAGLAFSSTDGLIYRHWLEGFDSSYGAPVSEARIGYTNLPPGRYVLHTQARNGMNGVEGNSLDLPFVVLATWMQTRWVQLLILGTVSLLVMLLYTSRIATLRSNERRLEAMVDERTRELRERAIALDAASEEKSQLLEQLGHQALHDSLTGLPNRHHADGYLAERFAAMRQGACVLFIAIMDVDHFKRINDDCSHQAGDQVLGALAKRMRAAVGLWCARIGGEEFLLISEQPREASAGLFEALRSDVACSPIGNFQGLPINATISIGWVDAAEFSRVDKALAEADRLLYQAKSAGRNRIEPAA
ncbi:two-component regulator propeller domain-containing protein, partial [Dokdonella sp.]|uniref:two-component regulator propeller domain-containing protein n=1 Tax=Dokdonella sp. TaxID=2291710 RepID=UPI003C564222